ncbi:MAG: YgiQ family radical SAM protein [Gammaproteobacteria bacterium]|uniref:YgiQ family radical SAM protein n=1 Tax=Candidatus Thiopontia autotrophica TaxID=2841688 RepID=A0A8J6P1A0_9GAMM|nr:YgiQ family radical SAM protein [Candidatus Thiopontia autotrophica]
MKSLFSRRKYWAHRFGVAPVLPMSREEMDELGWDSCDIILITGDGYVDHPSFGMALVGRLLESQGFRVGIISQPEWQCVDQFRSLGKPNLFFGVTAGNMDSMVNRYTSDQKIRKDDAYTPGGEGGRRPDRSTIVYSQRCREAYNEVPIIIGGIEASLRRLAHYDYWSDKVRRSILVDARADLLLYGNAERAIVEVAHRLASGEPVETIRDLRGSAYLLKSGELSESISGWDILDLSELPKGERSSGNTRKGVERSHTVITLPSFEQVKGDKRLYAHTSRFFHLETNPGNARALLQPHGDQQLWLNPPPEPLTTEELDRVYELPYTRQPHPSYKGARLPAYEMIRFSINIMRGCFGGCTFCSITEHEGRIIQNRSESSILREIEEIKSIPGFTGNISDLGGPTANMYRMRCKSREIESACRRLSCVYPEICKHMDTNHQPLINLYRKARELPGVKRIFIASGLRYDLAVRSPEYIEELVTHHVGGYLKIAPEHTEDGPLSKMMKPGIDVFYRFREMFDRFSKKAGKEQYLIPYFIAAHPGTTDRDMADLALWLKKNRFRPDQVQNFLPTPMSLATTMYHSTHNPLRKIKGDTDSMPIPKGGRRRRLHKAFLRYHDPNNWPLLRQALKDMGLSSWIGSGKEQLVPAEQKRARNRYGKVVNRGRRKK